MTGGISNNSLSNLYSTYDNYRNTRKTDETADDVKQEVARSFGSALNNTNADTLANVLSSSDNFNIDEDGSVSLAELIFFQDVAGRLGVNTAGTELGSKLDEKRVFKTSTETVDGKTTTTFKDENTTEA